MKHLFLAFLAVEFLSFSPLPSHAQTTDSVAPIKPESEPTESDAKMATIQFMNYMNYVVYTLSSYQNVFVIEEEYKNLSTGSINYDRIHDDKIIDAIEKMLDTIKEMRANEKDLEWFKAQQYQDRQRKQQEILVGIVKSTTSVAMDVASQNWSAVATGIAGTVGNVYSDWAELQQGLERTNSEKKFRYDQEKDNDLHEQNKYQLRLQYDLMKAYGIEDRFRFTDQDAKSLVEAVKSSNPKNGYARLRSMKDNNKHSFVHVPMFWRHFAWFAFSSGHYKEALEACKHFDEVNRYSIFRRDPMAANVAMTRISAMIALNAVDADSVRHALETIKAYNYDSTDVDMAYFCATTYYSLLDDAEAALEILDALIAVLEDRAREDIAKYRDLFTEEKLEAPWANPPMMTDLMRCHALQKSIVESEPNGDFRKTLESIMEQSNTSSIEKLFFVGDVRVRDLWKKARPDVEAIQLRYEKHDIKKNLLVALVPVSWFALGDFPISVDLLRGSTSVGTVNETSPKERKIALDRTVGDQTFAKIEMKCPTSLLKGVDGYVLQLPHKSLPVAIHFCPPVGVDVANAKFKDGVTFLIPQSTMFMNNTFPMSGGNETINSELFHVQLKNIVIPKELLRSTLSAKGLQAGLVDSQIYVEVSRMGETIWRSSGINVKIEEDKELYAFSEEKTDTSFALMWKPGDRIVVSVKVAEKAFVEAKATSAGGVAGALAGAGIGAAGAAAFSGGLAAPAGALIGAAVGFFGGAGAGALVPIKGEQTVVSFTTSTDSFGLNGKLEKTFALSKNSVAKASVLFDGGQRKDSVVQNGLHLQSKYVVRLRGVNISSKAPKFKNGAEYYMLVSLFGEEKPLRIDLPPLQADTFVPLESTLVLKNCGGESSVEIKRKSVGRDALVFKAVQGATNGSSWVFIGKSSDDYGSYVEFDTFPAGE